MLTLGIICSLKREWFLENLKNRLIRPIKATDVDSWAEKKYLKEKIWLGLYT
jgi:hypothetical protein